MKDDAYHVWVAVNINGIWYNVDPTGTYAEFLVDDAGLKRVVTFDNVLPVPRTRNYADVMAQYELTATGERLN